MKKIVITAIFTLVFSSTTFAGGWGGNQFTFSGYGGFNSGLIGNAEAFGVGSVQKAETFSMNEQAVNVKVEALRTVMPDSCQGTCDDNKGLVKFDMLQKASAGALHNAKSDDYAASHTNSDLQGGFDFAATLKGFGK